jgi:hypothetical protein
MTKKNSKMNKIDDIVQQIGREYVEKRMEIEETWQFEFDTNENRKRKQVQIDEVDRMYREKLREQKIEHILYDTIFRK